MGRGMKNDAKTAREVFRACLEEPGPSARRQKLQQLCRENHELCQRVQSLLEAAEVDDQFLETPVGQSVLGMSHSSLAAVEATAATSLSGRTLGDFRLLHEIGCGGMGVVYEARQISVDRRVALEVFPFAAVLDPRHVQRFENEVLAAASLNHPNIVSIYSVGSDRGVHYYAMEYVEGTTLSAHCNNTPTDHRSASRHGPTTRTEIRYGGSAGGSHERRESRPRRRAR